MKLHFGRKLFGYILIPNFGQSLIQ
jgi:hypothetical protein